MYGSNSVKCAAALWLSAGLSCVSFGQDADSSKPQAKAAVQPSEADMAAMMELAKPGENHKFLTDGVGTWSYKVKMWMNPDPNAPPSESSGTAVLKAVMDGRFVVGDYSGKFQMPGPDGKTVDMEFKGMSLDGYDNAQKKYVSSWIDNMGTGIMNSQGDYDAASKSVTYRAEIMMMPGVKTKVREVIRIDDKDHRTMEYYQDQGGKEVKTMEITYVRKR